MKAHLTDINVRTIKLTGKQFTVWDANLKGFGLRVSQAGAKSWVVMTGRDRRLTTLARYPTVSLKDARSEAKRLLVDPPKGSQLFETMLPLFLEASALKNKASTVEAYRGLFHRYILPKLSRRPLGDVQASEVSDIIRGLKSTPTTATHALVALKVFFNWAAREGYVLANPIALMQRPAQIVSRERILTDDELRRVWIATESCGQFGVIVKLLILTGQRRGEIAALQTEWLQTDTITIPAGVAKNGQQSVIPLSPLAVVLASNLATSRHLMTPFSAWSKNKKNIDALSHVSNWTLHDLRRTFSSGLAQLGTPLHVTEKILNHLSGSISGVAAVYNRYSFMEEMRAAVIRWEDKVLSLVR